jgi:hypothetical protein
VPSFLHELLADLFRERPTLALELLRTGAGIRLEGATVERGSIDLSQVVPTEYRADAVTVLRDPAGRAIAVVVAEVQLREDEDKRRTWPVYVTAARAGYRCPATLLVLAPDPAIARWASQPIDLGHPGFVLHPVVIGYRQVPRICDAAEARGAPELAVLSVMAHRDLETAEAAEAGLAGLPEEKQELYWDVITACLPDSVRCAMEARMIKGYEYQSEFARKYYFQGIEKGREEGREAGREEGREAGRQAGREEGREAGREEGLRRAIVALVCARLPELEGELEGRLRGQPEARLVEIATELGKVSDAAGVRAILDRSA